MTDWICMKRLAFFGYHGVCKEEAALGQRFFMDIECYVDFRRGGEGDNLDRSVRTMRWRTPPEPQDALQMCKPHLNLLPLAA